MTDDNTALNPADPTVGPDKDFLENAVKLLVEHSEDVVVTRSIDDLGVLITLQVNKDDMSKIIGKSGQTVRSLRTLLRVVGAKHDLRVNLKVLEPDGSEYRIAEGHRSRTKEHRNSSHPTSSLMNKATAGESAESAFDSEG